MAEVSSKVFAAVEILGPELVCELARALVRARELHPEFATCAIHASKVVYDEACELACATNERESTDRQRAEARDVAVTAIRFLNMEWLYFGQHVPKDASEDVSRPAEQVWGDDASRGVSEDNGEPTKIENMYTSPSLPKQSWGCSGDNPLRGDQGAPVYGPLKNVLRSVPGAEKAAADAKVDQMILGLGDTGPLPSGDGYDSLREVYDMALEQAKSGKGEERHANGLPFELQPICQGGRRFGPKSLVYQAWKKAHETPVLLGMDNGAGRAVRELLGVMNYAAAAIIVIKEGN